MFSMLVGVGIGLVLGWTLLPQPESLVDLWEKLKAKFVK